MTVTRKMISAAHDICLKKGDLVLSADLLKRIYLAMDALANRAETSGSPTTEAQTVEPDPLYRLLASAWYYGNWKAETANERAMQELMEQAGWWPVTEEKLIARHTTPSTPAAEPVACPYPCGWKNLFSIIVESGAFLARSLTEDEPITEHQRNEVMRMIGLARELALHGMKTSPAAEPKGETKC